MKLMAIAAALAVLAGSSAQAQQAPASWLVSTTITMADPVRVVCSVRFPLTAGMPRLTLANYRQPDVEVGPGGSARFDLRGLEPFIQDKRASIDDVQVAVDGRVLWDGLEGRWSLEADPATGRINTYAHPDIAEVIDPIARGLRLTVSFQLAGADHSFDYDLRGSRRAMVQLQKCLVD